MCMSVNKVIENCCESINEFTGARPIQENTTYSRNEIEKNIDDAGVRKLFSKNKENNLNNEKIFISDNLALTTQYTRKLFKIISNGYNNFQSTNAYT